MIFTKGASVDLIIPVTSFHWTKRPFFLGEVLGGGHHFTSVILSGRYRKSDLDIVKIYAIHVKYLSTFAKLFNTKNNKYIASFRNEDIQYSE